MNDVKLKMITSQYGSDFSEMKPENVQFFTEGKSEKKDGLIRFLYQDADEFGFTGDTTELDISEKDIVMRKKDIFDKETTFMIFRPGEKHKGLYSTNFGQIPVEILTKKIDKNLDEKGRGNLGIDYEISFDNEFENRNVLQIKIE